MSRHEPKQGQNAYSRCQHINELTLSTIDAHYETAGRAGLLHLAIWRPGTVPVVAAWVYFRASNEVIVETSGLATDYTIRYPRSRMVGLTQGDTLEIEHVKYRVRDVIVLGDGYEIMATLMRP